MFALPGVPGRAQTVYKVGIAVGVPPLPERGFIQAETPGCDTRSFQSVEKVKIIKI